MPGIRGPRAILLLAIVALCGAGKLKIGALYGENTHVNNVYKDILVDAQEHINRDHGFLTSGDEIAVVHFQMPEGAPWFTKSMTTGIKMVCGFIFNKDAHALIVPDDLCLNCRGLGAQAGNAFSPAIATDQAQDSGAIKMHPLLKDIQEMIAGVIKHYRWSDFIIIYDQDSGYQMFEALSKLSPGVGWVAVPVRLDKKNVAKQMMEIKARGIRNIVVYMHVEENIKVVIDYAYKLGLLKNNWHWLFGNLNIPFLGKKFLETKLKSGSAFITRFKMQVSYKATTTFHTRRRDPIIVWPYRQALTYDSLLATTYALRAYYAANQGFPRTRRCATTSSPLVEYFSKIRPFDGCSGEVAFDKEGNRVNYTIDIYVGKDKYLSKSKLGTFTQSIHHWEQKQRRTWPGHTSRLYMKPYRMSKPTHVHILSIEEPPLLMHRNYEVMRRRIRRAAPQPPARQPQRPKVDMDMYVGYIPHLLKEIKTVFEQDMGMDFTYSVELLGRGQYGRYSRSTHQLDGMMKKLYDGNADVIAAALTKTRSRAQFVDFTAGWYRGDIQLLVKHPSFVWEYPFVPLFPFDLYIWLTNLAALLVASILMWVISSLNLNEWRLMSRRGEATEEEGQTFTLYNSIFYMLSIWALQGYKRSPHSYAGRIMTAFWCAFCLIMVWLYVANLTPFLKASKTPMKIRSLYELNRQENFEFGLVKNSPTYDLFYEAARGEHRITWDDIKTGDDKKIVPTTIEGVRKVRGDNGRYALLSEKRMLEYEACRWPCNLWINEGYVAQMGFALAVQSGSPLRDQLSYALGRLKKTGILRNISMAVYHEKHCTQDSLWLSQATRSLTAADMAGVYYLMLLGFASSLIMFAIETIYFYLRANKKAQRSQKNWRKNTSVLGRSEARLAKQSSGSRLVRPSAYGVRSTEKEAADWL